MDATDRKNSVLAPSDIGLTTPPNHCPREGRATDPCRDPQMQRPFHSVRTVSARSSPMPPRVSSRARRIRRVLVALPSYSEELGLHLDQPSDWFPWFLAASLFAKPIPVATAVRTMSLLLQSGVRTPTRVTRTGWDELVRILDAGGYTRYDFSTADKLLEVARYFDQPGIFEALANEPDLPALEEQLVRIRGIGPKTVEIFLRELRGRWKCHTEWSTEALRASHRLGIDPSGWSLGVSNRRRLETGLVRLWLEHCKTRHWRNCPLVSDCGCRLTPSQHRDH